MLAFWVWLFDCFLCAPSEYDVGEVADKTKELREKAEAEDATAYEKQVAEAAKQYLELREYVDQTIRHYALPSSDTLLPDLPEGLSHVRTLVLDLDEVCSRYYIITSLPRLASCSTRQYLA